MFSFFKIPKQFELPKNMKKVGYDMFDSSIFSDNFKIPTSVLEIGMASFNSAKFSQNFKFPQSIKSISKGAFFYAKLPIGFQVPIGTKFKGVPFDSSKEIKNAYWDPQDKDGLPLPGSILKAGDK